MSSPSGRAPLAVGSLAWYALLPMTASNDEPTVPPAVRRVLEVVYTVDGVIAARVWQSPGKMAVGVSGRRGTSPNDLLRRVEAAVVGLREPGIAWDFGWLQET